MMYHSHRHVASVAKLLLLRKCWERKYGSDVDMDYYVAQVLTALKRDQFTLISRVLCVRYALF